MNKERKTLFPVAEMAGTKTEEAAGMSCASG